MRSHLLEGKVRHRRARPFVYALEHDVFYVALDLDELDEVAAADPARQPQPAERPVASGTATTSTRRRSTCARPSGSTCGPRASTRTAGGSRSSRTCASSATSSTRPASTSAGTRRASSRSSSSRSTTRTASGTCTRSAAAADGPRLRRLDGQGLLRLAVHRDGRALHRPGPGRAGAPADRDQRGPGRGAPPAHEPRPAPPAADRPDARPDAPPAPVRDPEDDRPHPLARPAPLAARRPLPSHGEAAR